MIPLFTLVLATLATAVALPSGGLPVEKSEQKDENGRVVFALCVSNPAQERKAAVLIDSIRRFGGPYSRAPVHVVVDGLEKLPCASLKDKRVILVSLQWDEAARGYPFAHKVYASAQVERRVTSTAGTLIWLDVETLILAPPRSLDLEGKYVVAMRPVFLVNTIGQSPDQPVDAYWARIYNETKVDPVRVPTVESFLERQRIRHYINCGIIAFRPDRGICGEWARAFSVLVRDRSYQQASCTDNLHQIFLHQAVLSSVIVARSTPSEWRWLPRDYGYPLNLHARLSPDKKARTLNELSCLIYDSLWDTNRDWMSLITIEEPLRTWIEKAYGTLGLK